MNPASPTTSKQLDLQSLDLVLGSFIETTKQEGTSRKSLYRDFLPRLVASTDAIATAVLFQRAGTPVALIGQSGWQRLDANTLVQVKNEIKNEGNLKRPGHTTTPNTPPHNAKNSGTAIRTFVGRTAEIDGGRFLFVLVRRCDADPLTDQLLADLIHEITAEVENFEFRRSAQQRPLVIQELTHLVQLTQNLAKTKSLNEMASHLVNDLAKATQANRVSFFSPRGKLLAVSGVSQPAKSSFQQTISQLAQIAGRQPMTIESTPDQLLNDDSRLARRIKRLLLELPSTVFYMKPLGTDQRCSGVVALEYFGSESLPRDWVDQRKLITQSLDYVTPIVDRGMQIYSIPGIGILNLIFNRILVKPLRAMIWLILLAGIFGAAAYWLFLLQSPFEIQVEGRLQPTTTRHVYAPDEGEIKILNVADGAQVVAGQPLFRIESAVIDDQRIAVEGELAETEQRLKNLLIADLQSGSASADRSPSRSANSSAVDGAEQRSQLAAEIDQWKLKQITLEKRLTLLAQRNALLDIVAPIEGQITTPDLVKRLQNRPVNRGDLLLSISDFENEWEIELEVPDNRVEFIQATPSPEIRFRIVAHSQQTFAGQLREFDFSVKPTNHGASASPAVSSPVSVWVDLDEKELGSQLRFGSRVIAKIHCGQRSNWFLLTYELENKIRQSWFW